MPLFPVDDRGYYHNIMSLIISQRIRFSVGQAIRRRIYTLQGQGDLTRVTELTGEQRKQVGLSDDKWKIILAFHEHYISHGTSCNVREVKGIGPWTVQSAQIMSGDYSCGFITTDLAVRKWVSKQICPGRLLTQKELQEHIDDLSLSMSEAGKLFSKIWNHTRAQTHSS